MASSSKDLGNTVDSLTRLMEKINISPIGVGSIIWIEVTHINNPGSFYVRPTSYNYYLPALQAAGSKIEPDELYLGNVVVFKSSTHKIYIRGQIIFIDEDNEDIKLELFAMDYGNIEKSVPISSIYKPLHTNCIPSLVKHCQLEICKPPEGGVWMDRSIDAMKFFIGDERTKIIIQDIKEDLLTVTMYNSCPEDISTMLALQGYSVFCYKNNSVHRFSATPAPKKVFYLFQELQIDDSINVRVQSGKSLKGFYVAEVVSYKKYLEQRENVAFFSKQANAIRAEDLCEGKPVCVPTTNRYSYERAIIKQLNKLKNRALVQLVDWGDIIEVPFERIKPIRESFLTTAAIAIFCTAEESQVWDNGLHNFLYPGYSFNIKIKSVGDSFETPYIVNISEITKRVR